MAIVLTPPLPPEAESSTARRNETGAPVTVLVMDDDEAPRKALSRVLEVRGYRVVQAETTEDAIDVLQSTPIDAAVLDVRLPKGSGLDVLKPLRLQLQHTKIPVLFWTGANLSETEEWFISLHGAHLFTKPEGMRMLADFLDMVTGGGQAH